MSMNMSMSSSSESSVHLVGGHVMNGGTGSFSRFLSNTLFNYVGKQTVSDPPQCLPASVGVVQMFLSDAPV